MKEVNPEKLTFPRSTATIVHALTIELYSLWNISTLQTSTETSVRISQISNTPLYYLKGYIADIVGLCSYPLFILWSFFLWHEGWFSFWQRSFVYFLMPPGPCLLKQQFWKALEIVFFSLLFEAWSYTSALHLGQWSSSGPHSRVHPFSPLFSLASAQQCPTAHC